MKEFQTELKIPKDRIAVLIGKHGSVKKDIEGRTGTELDINSKEGDVIVYGDDGLKIFEAKEVIQAIGRGFNPQVSLSLLNVDYVFDLISIKDFAGTKNSEIRLKSRVIGSQGKARRIIEDLSESNIIIYGKTIGIIGKAESVNVAKRAIMMLLRGSRHASVYHWLERKRKSLKSMEFAMREES